MEENIKDCLAIIVARGGSKRIPMKNIKLFHGHPIIKYSIDAAIQSNCFAEVMVSTDHAEIAKVAQSFGATIPFFRSAKNSDDYAGTAPVLKEVIEAYQKLGKLFKYICCLYPTAPFVTAEKITKAMNLLISKEVEAVVPVTPFSYPIQRSLKIEHGFAKMFWPENYTARSQDLEPSFHDCGQFYCLKVDSLLEQLVLYPKLTLPFIIPATEAQDIDSLEDWIIAEIKYELLQKKRSNA